MLRTQQGFAQRKSHMQPQGGRPWDSCHGKASGGFSKGSWHGERRMMLFWMKTSARTCGKIDNQHMSESFFDLCFLHAPNESACADSPHEQWVRFSLGFFHHFVEIPWSFKRQENMCKFPTSSLWIPPVSSWINEHGYGNPGNPPFMEIVQDFPAKVRMFPINGYPSD